MAKAGDTIESPLSGARIVFLKTARDTNGELLQLDDVMKGGGRVPIEHVHPYMEERFEILSGTARLSMRGQERDVGAGQTVVVPAGTPHVWGNPNEDEVHLILELRPALRMEEWFETFFGLQKDGKVNPKSGLPNALQWAVISREYEDEIYLASPPLLPVAVLRSPPPRPPPPVGCKRYYFFTTRRSGLAEMMLSTWSGADWEYESSAR